MKIKLTLKEIREIIKWFETPLSCGARSKFRLNMTKSEREALEVQTCIYISDKYPTEKHALDPWCENRFWKNVWKNVHVYCAEGFLKAVNLQLEKTKDWVVIKHPMAGQGQFQVGDIVIPLNPNFDMKNSVTTYTEGVPVWVSNTVGDDYINVVNCFGGELSDFRKADPADICRWLQTC